LKALKLITLTTDFGPGSSYVGQMKGAVLSVDGDIRIVDLCHDVPPQQIAAGAYLLESGYAHFPRGAVHVAVVDPGVGTARRAIAARIGDHYFVAPDNGLLGRVLLRESRVEARLIESPLCRRSAVSPTFEGRDLFSPTAANLAAGMDLADIGGPAGELAQLPDTRPVPGSGGVLELSVLYVDPFGNVTLDMTARELDRFLDGARPRLESPGGTVEEIRRTFQEGSGAGPFLLVNSAGYLEIAVREGRAVDELELSLGMRLSLTAVP
jgi:S-adenosylmethionine hydrolase